MNDIIFCGSDCGTKYAHRYLRPNYDVPIQDGVGNYILSWLYVVEIQCDDQTTRYAVCVEDDSGDHRRVVIGIYATCDEAWAVLDKVHTALHGNSIQDGYR